MKNYQLLLTKNYLINEYAKNKKNVYDIAEEIGCDYVTVYRYMKKHGVAVKMPRWDKILTKNFLEKEYIKNLKSLSQIAKMVNANSMTIRNYMIKYNIRIRTKSEVKIGELNPNYNGKFHGVHVSNFGSKNPNYKDGRTPLIRMIYQSKEYKAWRYKIYKRDHWTCQECGYKGQKIEAHHNKIHFVQIYELFKKSCSKVTLPNALNFSLFWDIDNGITLCKDCHLKKHKKQRGKDGKFTKNSVYRF
ncbi:MAG: hypothetical protein WC516_06065 [Patescibacteria group bacterium]|jgi:5-methylcytosine-specific restriction endonuclease McrA